MRWSSKVPSHPFCVSIPDQKAPNPLPRIKSNCCHAPPVQAASVKPLWRNLVSTTQLKRLKSIFINQCEVENEVDHIVLVPAPAGTDVIWSWHALFKPWLCQAGHFILFICLFAKSPFWIYPLLYLWVISQCSNTLLFNPLTTAWETTQS